MPGIECTEGTKPDCQSGLTARAQQGNAKRDEADENKDGTQDNAGDLVAQNAQYLPVEIHGSLSDTITERCCGFRFG